MRIAIVAALLTVMSMEAAAFTALPATAATPALRIYGPADPPFGFVQFCEREPLHCLPNGTESRRVPATPQSFAELDEVNRGVNKAVEPVSDLDQFGVTEYWTLPVTGKGDCEEYVLEKRRILMQRLWPSSALLITVVIDENRQGHAILTARMDTGDLILDNKHDEIRPWHKTPYTYVSRQSSLSPTSWVALGPADRNAPAVAAGSNGSAAR